jgi:hypothetical protein
VKLFGSAVLGAIALFMAFGLMRSDGSASGLAMAIAVTVTVVLPAIGSAALAYGHFHGTSGFERRRNALRQQTIESEVLRLAMARSGRLTTVEVVAELAVSAEQAQASLESLARRELAELAVSDSGVVVYVFRDVEKLGEKARAKGLLE